MNYKRSETRQSKAYCFILFLFVAFFFLLIENVEQIIKHTEYYKLVEYVNMQENKLHGVKN